VLQRAVAMVLEAIYEQDWAGRFGRLLLLLLAIALTLLFLSAMISLAMGFVLGGLVW
jgi:hypothetical protein